MELQPLSSGLVMVYGVAIFCKMEIMNCRTSEYVKDAHWMKRCAGHRIPLVICALIWSWMSQFKPWGR